MQETTDCIWNQCKICTKANLISGLYNENAIRGLVGRRIKKIHNTNEDY